jgi:hypothetical protein
MRKAAWTGRAGQLALAVTLALAVAGAQPVVAQDITSTLDDPRVGLAPGPATRGAGAAHMRLVVVVAEAGGVRLRERSDVHQLGPGVPRQLVYQGNFSGFMIWDVSNAAKPELLSTWCAPPTRATRRSTATCSSSRRSRSASRNDCGVQGVQDGADRMRGVRIFDVSNPRSPG